MGLKFAQTADDVIPSTTHGGYVDAMRRTVPKCAEKGHYRGHYREGALHGALQRRGTTTRGHYREGALQDRKNEG